jgi:N-acetylmuramoyl-L-alanine amidase
VAVAGSLLLLWAAAAPVVVIDPGHGGSQDGATGPDRAIEKTIALQIAKKLKAALEKDGAKVSLTREKDTDLPLPDRVAFANTKKPDLFLSVHANSMPTAKLRESTQGIETYFLSASSSGESARRTAARENLDFDAKAKGPASETLAYILADLQRSASHSQSSRLAYAIHQRLIAATSATDRGVQQAPFYVLMGVEAPAVLIEVGFISHPGESKKLGDGPYQDQLAAAVAEGVKAFASGGK